MKLLYRISRQTLLYKFLIRCYRLSQIALLLVFLIFIGQTALAQCPSPNTTLEHFETSTGFGGSGLTPATLNTPVETHSVWGGNYVRVNVVDGKKYKISTVGSDARVAAAFPTLGNPQAEFDPMITLFDNSGTTPNDGAVVGFNEDFSGSEKFPELEYTATYTGELYVHLTPEPGTEVRSFDGIIVITASATCEFFVTDSVSLQVTLIPTAAAMVSATKNSDTQITVTYDQNVQTNAGNPTDFTVTDGIGATFAVSAQADGTAGDPDIVLTVANLSSAVGDLTVTYTNNNNEISDAATGMDIVPTDATGVIIDVDTGPPTLSSAAKDSDTQITVTLSEQVQTNGTNPTDFTVVDGVGTNFAVSTQADGAANDANIVLTVASLATAVGDLKVTYTNNNNEISDFGSNNLATDATGVAIDTDATVPTLASAEQNSSTQITLTFSELVQTNGTNPTDFSVTDGIGTSFTVTAQADGTANDTDIVLTVNDMSAAAGDITVTYTNNNNEISDFGNNNVATDATGVSINTDTAAPTIVSAAKTSDTQLTLTFSEAVFFDGVGVSDGFTVTDGVANTYAVSTISDGTAQDTELILTVATLTNAVGDLTVTFNAAAPENQILDFGSNSLATDAIGVTIDTDMMAPTLVSGVRDNDTQVTLTFSEPVQTNAGNPTDFTVVDADNTAFTVSAQADGTANDTDIVLTVADFGAATGPLTVTYTNNNNEVSDFGGNDLVTDATGIEVALNPTITAVSVPANDSYIAGEDLSFIVTFDRAIIITGTPRILLTIGTTSVNAILSGTVNNATEATFIYTVQSGEEDTNGIVLGTAIDLNGATIQDADNLDALPTLNGIGATTAVLVDAIAPAAPVFGSISDDTGSASDDLITNDQTLIVTGTAEANSRLSLLVDGAGIFGGIIITVDGSGNWQFNPVGEGTFTLEEGVHTYTATTEDAAGNEGPVSENFVVTIDLTAPAQPTIDLDASTDLGISDSDNITSGESITLNGTGEPNSMVLLSLADTEGNLIDINGNPLDLSDPDVQTGFIPVDESGNWVSIGPALPTGIFPVGVVSQDAAGNFSITSEILTLTFDQETNIVSTSPVDEGIDVLPNTNLTITFDENVVKGTGNISIIQLDNDEVQQTVDVTGDNVTIDGATVTINPAENILPPDTEFYVNIDQGAFENEAGALFELSDNSTFNFTIIAASVVSSVTVPANGGYAIGDDLDFTVSMVLPVTITGGTPSFPVTIGEETVQATLVGTVTNSDEFTFRYTVVEDDLDADGITVGAAINLNGATMQDEFAVDAILTLNNVAVTDQVFVDGVRPFPALIGLVNTDSNIGGDFVTNDNTLEFIGFPVEITGDAEEPIVVVEDDALVAGDILEFFLNGESIGTAPVLPNGDFDAFVALLDHTGTTLADGSFELSIISRDSLGNSMVADDIPAEIVALFGTLIVDTAPPAAPLLDLVASTDLGISDSDNLTSDDTPTFEGTAEANSTVEVFSGDNSQGTAIANDAGVWTLTLTTALTDGVQSITAAATDLAGNTSEASEVLEVTINTAILLESTSPADEEIDVLPNANLTLTFDENVVKGTGNIQIIQSSNDAVQQTIDVAGDNVSVDGATVIIDPAENILPPDTEFYVNIDQGAFENEAGASFAGLSDNSTFSFTIIAASVVTEVSVPADDTYMIGDQLDFTANMVLPVSITGTATIPVTIGDQVVNATQVGTVSNASTITFRYTVLENDLDIDGIAVGDAINLNGGTMRDEFDVDALLALNNVASTEAILVDAIRPDAPIISSITEDTGSSSTDGVTNDADFVINGTAEANATLMVEVAFSDASGSGSNANSNVPVDENGDWSFGFGFDFSDRDYQITATATDTVGNTGSASDSFVLTIDTTPPAQPTIDLDASTDLGISNSDNLTSGEALILNGTAEPNSTIFLFLVDENGNPADGSGSEPVAVDDSGNWTLSEVGLPTGTFPIAAIAQDAAGNESVLSETLTIISDQDLAISATSPVDDEIDVLPNANLTITFDKNIVKGTGNIQIIQSSNDAVQQTIDVAGDNVSVDGATVIIDPAENILPPDTEFYVNIDQGAFENEAGASFAGLSDNSTFSFTIIAASVVTEVSVPADDTYMIGDQLDFTANMVLPVSITGTATIPVTIGDQVVNATQVGTVSNASTITFRYTVLENDLDIDGIAVGDAINLNGGTMRDEFDVDAILTLNNVAPTASVLVDGVKPTPVISSDAVALVNGTFSATVTFDEAMTVSSFTLADITVVNGTVSNLVNTTTGTVWTVDITPLADGTVTASLAANTATDLAGNDNNASNSISREFDGTAPEVLSINRSDADQLVTGTTAANFRIIFSEDVSGVDLSDLEVVLTATATGALNSITPVDGSTYDVNVNGIGGQGTIGLNMLNDNSIEDAATNSLAAAFTGQVYTTNFIPTDISLSISNADENNQLTQALAIISTIDADAGDSHTYTLVAGSGDTDNASFSIDGTNLRANNLSFNFEDQSSYDLRLMTDDGNGGTYEEAFTLAINDLNEVPIMLSLSNNDIDESDEAQPVGDFSALDQDAGDTFTYTLVTGTGDTGNAEFVINGTTLSTTGLINFEDGATRSILVRVTDSGGLSIDRQFTINIGEVVIEALREYETNIPGGAVRNIFSPNGDGVNDTWTIEDLLDNPVNTVKVYAQGGKLVFSQDNYRNDWDGTFKGDPIPDGTYYYEINVYDGERIIKGFLTIIRNR